MPTTPGSRPATGDDAVAADGLVKSFGPVAAVAGVDLRVGRGEVVALLGPNGAGKSTTIGLLLGQLRPDRGSIRLFGSDPGDVVAAGRVGAMFQDGGLPPGATVGELLAMLGRLYPRRLDVARVVGIAQLGGLERRRVDRLSGGQTQRLRLAVALVGDPELLVLDEPTAAMDVEARRSFWAAMHAESARGRTVLFSTHHLEEAESSCDRVVVLAGGRVVADAPPADIAASLGSRLVRFETGDATGEWLERLPGVESVRVRHRHVELRSRDSDATLRALVAADPTASKFEVVGAGLEEAFVALVGR